MSEQTHKTVLPRRCRRGRALGVLLVGLALSAQGAASAVDAALADWQGADPDAIPARNVRLPIAHHPDGSVRAVLHAVRLWAALQGPMRAEQIEVVLFDPERAIEGVMILERGVFDRERAQGVGLGPLRLQYQGVDLQGTNAVWSGQAQTVTFPERSTIRFRRDQTTSIQF